MWIGPTPLSAGYPTKGFDGIARAYSGGANPDTCRFLGLPDGLRPVASSATDPLSVPAEGTEAMAEPSRTHNRLLDRLPNGERRELVAMMNLVPITPHDVIQLAGEQLRSVYFPVSGVISLMTPLQDGTSIETATVGNEGMVGVHAYLGGGVLGNALAMSQVPGQMFSVSADRFRAFVEGDGKLRDLMSAYRKPSSRRSARPSPATVFMRSSSARRNGSWRPTTVSRAMRSSSRRSSSPTCSASHDRRSRSPPGSSRARD
jgi:CRP-like cAMP-binding protein